MNAKHQTLESLDLTGLRLAPAQVMGAVRIIPLLRDEIRTDLRLARQRYGEDAMAVSLDGKPNTNVAQPWYCSFVPHAFVVQWSDNPEQAAAFGAHLFKQDGKRVNVGPFTARVGMRMARRVGKNALRILPLHLAMEGFLALHFGGPDVAWSEYSRRVRSRGLDPRSEHVWSGRDIAGLQEALRIFEFHEEQCGALFFVADALAAAFVVPHPDDYRALHRSVIEDFFGDLILRYSQTYDNVGRFELPLGLTDPTVDGLREALGRLRRDWSDVQRYMADGIFGRPLESKRVYDLGPFRLQRFVTDLDPGNDNHIGECILRNDGTVEYLKTYRLSAAQVRRAYLLKQLAANNWDLDKTAEALETKRPDLILRLENAGFGYILHAHVIAQARKQRRR